MKPLALLLAALLCCGLCACSTTPEPTTQPTVPTTLPPPTHKTIYVHTAVTQSSATLEARTEFLYNENDHLKEVVQYSGTNQTLRYQVECDENGNFITWNCATDKLDLTIRYSYDHQGRSLGTAHYQNGEMMTATTYTWEGDNRTGVYVMMPSQNRDQATEYTYNAQGVLVRQDVYADGDLVRYGICTSDEENRTTVVAFYLPNGTPESTTTIVYEGLTQTHTMTQADGRLSQRTVITYDGHGNLLSTVIYDGEGNQLSSETHTWKAIQVPIDCPRASA